MNTTVRMKQSDVYKDWHVIDAAGRPLGRVATEAATLLKGKHKPTYERHLDDGDFVIVVNASQVTVSGNKAQQIKYHRHSGYPGGLKTRTYEEQMAKFPERVIEQAIWGMLPKGPLGKQMFRHLKVYRGPNHPHQSQIASTANAQEARKAEVAALIERGLVVKKLRPLSVPQVVAAEDEAPKAKAPSAAAAAARQARARVRGTAPEETTAEADQAPVAEAPAAEAPAEAEAPKRATRRKAADTAAEATDATTAESPAEAEAPKRTRRKAADADAPTAEADPAETEEKKPRRRAAAKSEGTEE